MKKIILFLMASVLLLGAVSCTSCNQEKQKMETVVEKTIQSDRTYMCDNYGCANRWYETTVQLNEYLDEDCTGTVYGVTNVFQVAEEIGDGYDTRVVMITHSAEAMQVKEVHGFWVEDYPLDASDVKITYRQAYERLMAANFKKPHSRNCVLRKEVGPVECNAQYIFGNTHAQLYVDAVTGEVSDINPAFNKRE